ncbi:hypothetical protein BDZ97DRAFT_804306 [Flammula alnicola]|nr:hypothetical protein BDZ97DRAFT_804306 [Flammula alnicola]
MPLKVFDSGGAATNAECVEWANQMGIPLVLDIGMTELGGPLFHSTTGGAEGWYSKDCLLADAALNLVDEAGANATSEGELVIKSRLITKGYLQYDNSSFTVEDDGTVSFRTVAINAWSGKVARKTTSRFVLIFFFMKLFYLSHLLDELRRISRPSHC